MKEETRKNDCYRKLLHFFFFNGWKVATAQKTAHEFSKTPDKCLDLRQRLFKTFNTFSLWTKTTISNKNEVTPMEILLKIALYCWNHFADLVPKHPSGEYNRTDVGKKTAGIFALLSIPFFSLFVPSLRLSSCYLLICNGMWGRALVSVRVCVAPETVMQCWTIV